MSQRVTRSSTRQPKPPERYNDGALSWQEVAELFPDMDEEDVLTESDISGGGSDYGEDEDYTDEESEQEEGMAIDPALTGRAPAGEEGEDDIQDDFQALVNEMNQADETGDGTNQKERSMAEQEMDLRQHLRAAARIGKPRKSGRRRGRTQYSEEVRNLLSAAQTAFVEQNLEEAIRCAQEAVRIEPRAAEGYSVLAGVYSDMGDEDAALKFRIVKAHMTNEAETWKQLAAESLQLNLPRQALYCYRKAIQIDRTDEDAIWDRAFLLKGLGDYEPALKGFTDLLELHPHNPNVLLQIYQICLELNDLPRALQLYQAAFDFYRQFPPNEDLFGIPSLSILADLHISTGTPDLAIQTVKSGTRWLQYRSAETFWDMVEDDREYDPQGFVREALEGQDEEDQEVAPGFHPLPYELRHRLAVARLKTGDDAEAQIHVDVIRSMDRGLHPEYSEYMMEIGDAYFERGLWEEAYAAYDDVHGTAEIVSRHLLMQMGRCLRNLGRLADAIQVLEQVIEAAPDSLEAKLDLVELLEASGQLERAYELVLQIKRSRQQERDAETQGEQESSENTVFQEARATTRRAATAEEKLALEEQRTEIAQAIYQRLKSFEERAEAGDTLALEEWMFQARRLVDMFRQSRALFLSDPTREYTGWWGKFPALNRQNQKRSANIDQDVADISARLQESIEDAEESQPSVKLDTTSFRGITFQEWLQLFVTFSFRLVRRGDSFEATNILRHVSYSVVYNSSKDQDTLNLALLAIAVHDGDYPSIRALCRRIMYQNQFNNDAYRIMLAAFGTNIEGYLAFIDTSLAKFLNREVKTTQAALRGERMVWHKQGRWTANSRLPIAMENEDADMNDASSGEEAEQQRGTSVSMQNVRRQILKERPGLRKGALPTKPNPVLYATYGQMLMSSKSYQSSLFYFMHAYDVDPYDPLSCLCLAVSYVGRSMQRQSDNRHHQIVQGLAFLTRYRNLRQSLNEYAEEIEYNFGRYFHHLNILHLASKHYRRALDIARKRLQSGETIPAHAPVKEAAYNLSLIYATTGGADIAQALYEEWLTI